MDSSEYVCWKRQNKSGFEYELADANNARSLATSGALFSIEARPKIIVESRLLKCYVRATLN